MITLTAHWARKMPGPVDFSSVQAQASIQIEVGSIAEVPQRAREAFALVEQAVDEQLRHDRIQAPAAPPATTPAPAGTPNTARPSTSPNPTAARSAPSSNRRAPAAVTDSQLRFIDKLIAQTGTSVEAILAHHQVGTLRDLSCKVAAGLIDELKSKGVAR